MLTHSFIRVCSICNIKLLLIMVSGLNWLRGKNFNITKVIKNICSIIQLLLLQSLHLKQVQSNYSPGSSRSCFKSIILPIQPQQVDSLKYKIDFLKNIVKESTFFPKLVEVTSFNFVFTTLNIVLLDLTNKLALHHFTPT